MSKMLVRVLALMCGVTIANVYYAQPLLHTIAHDMGVGQSEVGIVVIATQAGFAAGLVFVVPLGDILARRPVITALLTIDAVALAGSAAAPGLRVLSVLAVLVGISSVVVQMTIPYAATLVGMQERARTIGTLMGAVLLGVLLSRTFAGVVAGTVGWRCVYAVAAGLMAVMAVVMSRVLPAAGREVRIGYFAQMGAVLRLATREPTLRWRSLIGAAQYATFSCFWSTVTFLLTGRPFGYAQAEIGLFALVGVAGAGCVMIGGRLLDRHQHRRWRVTGAGTVLLLGSFVVLAAGAHHLEWLIVGALLMDACSQIVHVTNQAVIYDLVDAARSRVTTVYMTTYFVGGAVGTASGVTAYGRYGWSGACAVAAGFCGVAMLGWMAAYRHERPAPASAATAMADALPSCDVGVVPTMTKETER